jgi:hypothetical protein
METLTRRKKTSFDEVELAGFSASISTYLARKSPKFKETSAIDFL